MVKEGIRKCLSQNPSLKWWEIIPDIAWALRTIPTRSTKYAPYTIVFKHQPILPMMDGLRALDIDSLGGDEGAA